jgi:hypothetical protein
MSSEVEPLPPVPDDFEAPTLASSSGRRWTVEDYTEESVRIREPGISGLWFPEAGVMVVTPRRLHHNDQLASLDSNGVLDRPGWDQTFVPWLWLPGTPERGAELDFPRSAGGAFQYVSRNDIPPTYISKGDRVDESDVYAAVWTCKRLDCPEDTQAGVSFLPQDSRYEPGSQLAIELGVFRTDRDLEEFYRELEFAGVSPEPAFSRGEQWNI